MTEIFKRIFAFIMSCAISFPVFAPVVATAAESVQPTYSSALADLQKDDSFDKRNFPSETSKYHDDGTVNSAYGSIRLIQLAESIDKELFIYTYQPSWLVLDVKATTIRFSTAINDGFSPRDYGLEYLNNDGVFYKYKVKDFEIKADLLRYYDVVAIHRPWIEGVDDPAVAGETNEVAFEVAELWTACTVADEVTYTTLKSKVVTITNKYVGHLVYDAGFILFNEKCHSHFVAFSTDYDITTLEEAEVAWVEQGYHYVKYADGTGTLRYDDPVEADTTLYANEQESYIGNGLFAVRYTWQRIETAAAFVSNNELTSAAAESISKMQYVLRFKETSWDGNLAMGDWIESGTRITNVTILRLKFKVGVESYNLGVVDNKQTADPIPDNTNTDEKGFDHFKEAFDLLSAAVGEIMKTIGIVFGVLLLVVLLSWVAEFVKFLIILFKTRNKPDK